MTKIVRGSAWDGFGIECISNLFRVTRIVLFGELSHVGQSINGESEGRGNLFVATANSPANINSTSPV